MKFNLVECDDYAAITVFVDGEMYVADVNHPNFDRIVEEVLEGNEDVVELFDIEKTVVSRFERLSDRVTVGNGVVYFDSEPVDNALTKQIIRFLDEGVDDFKPLVNFYEKVAANPNQHSREQLYRWLAGRDFTITEDGDIVGYKGVNEDLTSVHSGPAVVDGVPVNGNVPNNVGSVIEMERGKVHEDPSVGCSVGLHVGTYEYAKDFGHTVLEVHVNPNAVVSVPTDCQDSKMRVCRYTVVAVCNGKKTEAVTAPAKTKAKAKSKSKGPKRDARGRFVKA